MRTGWELVGWFSCLQQNTVGVHCLSYVTNNFGFHAKKPLIETHEIEINAVFKKKMKERVQKRKDAVRFFFYYFYQWFTSLYFQFGNSVITGNARTKCGEHWPKILRCLLVHKITIYTYTQPPRITWHMTLYVYCIHYIMISTDDTSTAIHDIRMLKNDYNGGKKAR